MEFGSHNTNHKNSLMKRVQCLKKGQGFCSLCGQIVALTTGVLTLLCISCPQAPEMRYFKLLKKFRNVYKLYFELSHNGRTIAVRRFHFHSILTTCIEKKLKTRKGRLDFHIHSPSILHKTGLNFSELPNPSLFADVINI